MFQQLLSHSPDIKRLFDEGYQLEVHEGYLIIHHVPYVNSMREVKLGSLACALTLINPYTTTRPNCHTIYFSGDTPCNNDGTFIHAILNSDVSLQITNSLTVNHLFSNKPPEGYLDFYEKFTRYITIISSPAFSIDEHITAKPFKLITNMEETSVFQYADTNTSRASIVQIANKVVGQKIAIIGMGGTGGYILDSIAKTPVSEIHIYDGDIFLQHNAFRAPGASSIDQLLKKLSKVSYYSEMYGKMHKSVIPHECYINQDNLGELKDMDYIFICVDNGDARKLITDYLVDKNKTFIDVGLGVNIVDDFLIGTARVTTGAPDKYDHLAHRLPFAELNNDYAPNIQISDLNAMNALLAVIKWKKLSGFYVDLSNEYNLSFTLTTSKIFCDDVKI